MKYPPSMMSQDMGRCYLCGIRSCIEVHHVFGGATRSKSTMYGLVVPLCRNCHTGMDGVHYNRKRMDALRKDGQRAFEERYGHDLFMKEFHRNYLEESEWKK